MIRFRVARATSMHESSKWSPPQELDPALSTFVRKAERLGDRLRYRIRQRNDGDRFGMERNIADTVKRLHARLERADLGDVFAVKASTQQGTVRGTLLVRVIDVEPKLRDTLGNFKVDRYVTEVLEGWTGVELWGTVANRNIAGTSTRSQHYDWPPLSAAAAKTAGFPSTASSSGANAVDLHHDDGSVMKAIYDFSVRDRADLDTCNVIYNERIWNPTNGDHPYGGVNPHRDHVHWDALPTRH